MCTNELVRSTPLFMLRGVALPGRPFENKRPPTCRSWVDGCASWLPGYSVTDLHSSTVIFCKEHDLLQGLKLLSVCSVHDCLKSPPSSRNLFLKEQLLSHRSIGEGNPLLHPPSS